MTGLWPWLALAGLGAYHGINPAMGWLFAVGLGLQRRRRSAVIAALGPLALGHALSIGAVVAAFYLAGGALPFHAVRIGAAAILIGVGLYRLIRARHPRWSRMQAGFGDLTVWSFLMASAHGAGLLLLPVLIGAPSMHDGHAGHAGPVAQLAQHHAAVAVAAVGVHTIAYFVVTAAIALLVYEKLGVAFLRSAWLNMDRVWAIVLIATGGLTLII
jgi:hypothetical protein